MIPAEGDRPEHAWLQELIASRGDELRRSYGAHALGIGRVAATSGEPDRLALRVYVDPDQGQGREGAVPVPATIAFTPSGRDEPVHLSIQVVESPAASLE